MVQVWYPAAKPATGKLAPFVADFEIGGPAIAKRLNFPTVFVRHVDLVHTHSHEDAPILTVNGRFRW